MTSPPDNACLSRREARRRDRRDAIIAVAKRSFLENGFAATTMSSIAAELGGSKGTLWSYFPGKEELFAAVLRDATGVYHASLAELLDTGGEVEPTLLRFSHDLLRKVTSPDAIALHRLVAAEASRFPKMGAIFQELAPLSTRNLLARFLEAAMAKGQLRQADAMLAARPCRAHPVRLSSTNDLGRYAGARRWADRCRCLICGGLFPPRLRARWRRAQPVMTSVNHFFAHLS